MPKLEFVFDLSVETMERFFRGRLPDGLVGFGIIGLLGFVTHFITLGLLSKVFDSFLICHYNASFIAASQNFVLNQKFNFKSHSKSRRAYLVSFLKFMVITSPSVLLWGGTTKFFVGEQNWHIVYLSGFAALCDFFCRFILCKLWVFDSNIRQVSS